MLETYGLQLGDRIIGKKTGTLTPSTIIGFAPAKIIPSDSKDNWNRLYPDWTDKMIVFSEFDEPTRNCTIEEFKLGYPLPPEEETDSHFVLRLCRDKNVYNEYIEFLYDKMVPTCKIVSYPIDDVEKIE